MQIPVEIQRGRSRGTGDAGIALVALGSIAIGTLKLGFLVTLAVASITMIVGFGGLRPWSAWWRRRKTGSPTAERLLTASATMGRDTGVLTVASDALTWTGGTFKRVYVEGEIKKAMVRPLRLVGAAELRILTDDGAEVMFTVTAPARTIERALSHE